MRTPRSALVGQTYQIVLEGHNGSVVFHDHEDHAAWLNLLAQQAREHQVDWHAYVTLPSQARLLATPRHADSLSRWMQACGRLMAQRVNQRFQRRGSLWEGRFRSALVQPDLHVLQVMVWFDWLPVVKGMATSSVDYPWSSYHHYSGGQSHRGLIAPPAYWALGNDPFAREQAYRTRVQQGMPASLAAQLESWSWRGLGYGDAVFLQQMEQSFGIKLVPKPRGRPPKKVVHQPQKPITN